jgi:DNA-binding NtrC family response regulator
MRVRKYDIEDYEGEFNLKRHEKELILKAYVKFSGKNILMATALRITPRSLYDKICTHGLEKVFSSSAHNLLVISMIQDLVKTNISSN